MHRSRCVHHTHSNINGRLTAVLGISVPSLSEESIKFLEAKLESRATKSRSTGDTREDGGLDIISSTLLRTNHQCNSTQVCSVKMMIAQRTDNIKAIDYDILSIQFKINELMNSIKALKDSRLQEKKEISFCKYILSPIRLLPPELLTRIFKYTVTVFRPSHRSKSALALAHVCSAWRDAVFGCSYFWNQMELLVAPHTKASPGPRFSERVASWYGHSSSSQPLRLSVRIEGTPEDCDVLADLSQSITAFSPRLVKLSLDFMSENYDALAPFLCLPPDSLPALESLCLLASEADEDTPILPPTNVFAAAPCLRTLYLSIPSYLLTDPTRLRLPWTQLTRLEIANTITLSTFTDVLFQCAPHLRSARFACINGLNDRFGPEMPRLPSAPQIFPCLEYLHLSVFWIGPRPGTLSIVDVLPLLRLPNLQTLQVNCTPAFFPMYALLPALAEPGGTAEARSLRYPFPSSTIATATASHPRHSSPRTTAIITTTPTSIAPPASHPCTRLTHTRRLEAGAGQQAGAGAVLAGSASGVRRGRGRVWEKASEKGAPHHTVFAFPSGRAVVILSRDSRSIP
ncbi:hypothetical protein D9615_009911 [Tricholomella constricta]|uniref:F-box domain-containing protein n=1 Tax=Tricholomella constricta TaxID=117010 RepID=A0A8H5GZJ7_9AGAR|nr:hypothetical protein D9615_009911 [Tricholomella constricta]